jgi:hypothetical protein
MSIALFLNKLQQTPEAITFAETIATIESNYDFTPTAFQNGKQHNGAGENSGSCKSQAATLACFGSYYFEEVLGDPQGTNHQNIRNFMQFGWDGIQFEGEALALK